MFIFIFIILLILNFKIENFSLSDNPEDNFDEVINLLIPILRMSTILDYFFKIYKNDKSLIALKKQEINIKLRKTKLKKFTGVIKDKYIVLGREVPETTYYIYYYISSIFYNMDKKYPEHWGNPPTSESEELVELPHGYGRGPINHVDWINNNVDTDYALFNI